MDRREATEFLRSVPALIDEAVAAMSDVDLRRRPAADEWSVLEVCCHLRDYAEIEGQRARLMVDEDEPVLQTWDQDKRARERDYAGDDPQRVATALRAFWLALADWLDGLTDEQWERGGSHPEAGRVTVRSRVERQRDHARLHVEQIKSIRQAL